MRTETFAFFFGIAYLSAGLLGLHPAALMPAPDDAPPMQLTSLYGYLLGLFPVNLPLSVVHVAIGAWGILAWRRATNPRVFAGALAVLCGALAVAGLIPRLHTLFGMMPLHRKNIWLHVGNAALPPHRALHPEASVQHRAGHTPQR